MEDRKQETKPYFKTPEQREVFIERLKQPIAGIEPKTLVLHDGSFSCNYGVDGTREIVFVVTERECYVVTFTPYKTTASAVHKNLQSTIERTTDALINQHHELWVPSEIKM